MKYRYTATIGVTGIFLLPLSVFTSKKQRPCQTNPAGALLQLV
ncbi:hypothetical protein [Pontibacter fetidus]|nr:hypothetical protein [Pontibacter fetidus]